MIPAVLAVEDEPVICEQMAILLKGERYAVRQAVDGLQALEMLERLGIDLVLSDVKMPRLGGGSLVSRLRSRGDALPILRIATATVMRTVAMNVTAPAGRLRLVARRLSVVLYRLHGSRRVTGR